MKQYINVLTLWAISLLSPIVVQSQTLNPSYLSEMPVPSRILAEIKGKDAEDTGERQMGAFRALVQMMDDMASGLGHRYVNDADTRDRSEEHTSELQSHLNLVCRLLLEKKKKSSQKTLIVRA